MAPPDNKISVPLRAVILLATGLGLQTLRADRPPNRGAILDEAMRCHASHIEATGDR